MLYTGKYSVDALLHTVLDPLLTNQQPRLKMGVAGESSEF